MPLEPYLRGSTWWAKGRVEYEGSPISDYIRCSTDASEERGAWAWCQAEERIRIRRFLLGDKEALTFAEAVLIYPANAKTAEYLIPIIPEIGDRFLVQLTPAEIRGLGPKLYPRACADTWLRQVISPIRAVMNHAHDEGKGPAIRIKGYDAIEREEQDKLRKKPSRVKKKPGSWEWLLQFREHADRRHAALAHLMFTTGARISQAIEMHPVDHLDLQNCMVCIPAAKGFPERWIQISPELTAELANLPVLYPRGWERKPKNARVFGFADRSSPRKGWDAACDKAGIERLTFHAAGRHGFGQEMNVRNPVDEKAAGEFGGWADTGLMKRVYTHAEDAAGKVLEAQAAGRKAAEESLKLKMKRSVG